MFAQPASLAVCLLLLPVVLWAADPDKDVRTDRHGDALPPHVVLRIGTSRFRHAGAVTSILFAADGKTVFTGSEDKTISRWDVETGQELARFGGTHQREVTSLALSADGKLLYSCAADATSCLWEVEPPPRNPALLPVVIRPTESLNQPGDQLVILSAEGTWVASASCEGDLYVKRQSKTPDAGVFAQNVAVRVLAFSADAKLLAANTEKGGVTIWDVKEKKRRHAFGKGAFSCMAFAPDGDVLASGDFDNVVRLWDLNKQEELASLERHHRAPVDKKNGIFCLAFSPDGKWLATGAGDATVRIWDVAKRKQAALLDTERVTALAFSPDSKRLLTGGADHALRLWDVNTAKEVRTAGEPAGPLTAFSLHPDGQLLATLQAGNHVRIWDLKSGKLSDQLADLPGSGSAILFMPDGKTVLTGDNDKSLFHSWDLKSGKETVWPVKAPHGIGPAAAVDTAGKRLVSANPSGRVLTVWDAREGTISRQLDNIAGSNVTALAVSPDGLTAAGAGSSASIRLWRLADGSQLLDCSGHPGGTTAVTFSTDGRQLASVGKDRMIRLWEVISGQERRAMGGQKGWILALAFDPKSRLLATGNTDGMVRIWDARNGKLVLELTGHRGAVTGVAFTAKGDRLVSVSADTTALVWDVQGVLAEEKKLPQLHLKDQELDRCWKDLAEGDVATAAAAIQTLARAPEQSVPLMRERGAPLNDKQLAQLIKDLDSDDFQVRQKAKRKLAEAGKFAETALGDALKNNPSPEVTARIKELLEPLADQRISPDQKRMTRCVEVLEMIDTKDARAVLKTLAEGAKNSDLTQQAKAALERMTKPDAEKD